MRRAELLRYRLPAIVWAAIILGASGSAASAGQTEAIIRGIVTAVVGAVSDPTFEIVHFIIRKAGHVLAYGIAGALNFYAVRGPRRGWMLAWSVIAVVLAVVTASLDEWHQSFVATRTGMPSDVVIDFCGAVLAQMLWRRLGTPVSSRA